LCQAHAKGVRVLQDVACDMAAHGIPGVRPRGSNCVDSNGTTSDHYYRLNFTDPAARAAWAADSAARVVALGIDGAIFDIEGGVGNPPHVVEPAAVLALVQELRAALRRADPGLIMGAFVSVNVSDLIATGNPYDRLVPTLDFFAIMGYDMVGCACTPGTAPCGPEIRGKYCNIAGADAPYQLLDEFVGDWLALPGMRPRQLMLILPAQGFWFRCNSTDPALPPGACEIVTSNRISHNRAHNLRCGRTGLGPGSPPCPASAHHSPNITTPRRLDPLTKTAVFNAFRRDGSPAAPSYDAGLIEQIWYDDAGTIGLKVKMARDKHGIGGVGLYGSTGGYPDKEKCDGCMWPVYQAIKANFIKNATDV
jgi:hypothetical protein